LRKQSKCGAACIVKGTYFIVNARQVFETAFTEDGGYAGIATSRPSSSEGAFLQLELLGLRGRKIAEEG